MAGFLWENISNRWQKYQGGTALAKQRVSALLAGAQEWNQGPRRAASALRAERWSRSFVTVRGSS